MDAIITGITTPQKATNFPKPVLWVNALRQTTNTKPFVPSCSTPDATDEPTNRFVKLAIRKKLKPVIPEIAIHNFWCFKDNLLNIFMTN